MKILIRSLIPVLALTLLQATTTFAQTPPPPPAPTAPTMAAPSFLNRPQTGMRHMTVVPDESKAVPPQIVPVLPVAPPPSQTPPAAEKKPPLDAAKALMKPEELTQWSHLSEVVLSQTKDSVDQMVRIVEADPGSVPPQALFFLAKGLAEQGRMEDAGLYYYAGQLRLSFDTVRWPPRIDPADLKRMMADRKKTQDQRGQIPIPSEPQLRNPHEAVSLLATSIGAPISQWMLEDPARGDAILARVKEWDESTPYAYHPGYDLPEPISYDEWPKRLSETREGFYKRINQFLTGLKKLKAQYK